jgi:hypothetical protein
MTSSDYPTVKTVSNAVKASYNALDLRSLIIKEGQDWVCLFCIIRATINDHQFVKSMHDNKRSNIRFKEPANCKFIFESKKINDMDSIFTEMQDRHITIGGLECQLKNPFYKSITHVSMKKQESSHAIYENDKKFLHVCYQMIDEQTRKSALDILQDSGYKSNNFGFDKLRDISSLYDTDDICYPINFVLSFPIYCNIDEFRFEKDNEASAMLQIHESLYPYCEVFKEIKSENDNLIGRDTVTPIRQELNKGLLRLTFSIDARQLIENQS